MQLQSEILTQLRERTPFGAAFLYFKYYPKIYRAFLTQVNSELEAHLLSIEIVKEITTHFDTITKIDRDDKRPINTAFRRMARHILSAMATIARIGDYSTQGSELISIPEITPTLLMEAPSKSYPDNGQFIIQDVKFLKEFWTQEAITIATLLKNLNDPDLNLNLEIIFSNTWFSNESLSRDLVEYYCENIVSLDAPYNQLCKTICFGKPYSAVADTMEINKYWVERHALKSALVAHSNIVVEHWPLFLIFIRMWTTYAIIDVCPG